MARPLSGSGQAAHERRLIKMAGEYSILIGHVAALRRRAIDLRHAVAGETTTKRVTGRVQQIPRELEAEADQLEKVARTKP